MIFERVFIIDEFAKCFKAAIATKEKYKGNKFVKKMLKPLTSVK